ncbi:MAG TPA: MFS transporter, partial [Gaiellaceae bacterium]|nr:MFS transporter [Gaiellaceae bacterium]
MVLLLQVGNAFNWLGYGLILPFEIIYLHQFRGISTATAGLVLAAILGAGTVATPPSGALLDRFRPKSILIAANLASAVGYTGLALVERPWQAFACALIGGAGVGVNRTANNTLPLTLVTPEQRVASFALGRAAQKPRPRGRRGRRGSHHLRGTGSAVVSGAVSVRREHVRRVRACRTG